MVQFTSIGSVTSLRTLTTTNQYTATLTVASGTVGSDLTDFPIMVRLSDMPAGFWNHGDLRYDGGNIRVRTTGGSLVPHDLVRFEPSSSDGVLFFKGSITAATDVSWNITIEDPADQKLAVTDTNGRNNVWSDYESVFIFGETAGDDRTGYATGAAFFNDPDLFEKVSQSTTDLNSHQGVCWDGTHYYTTDDNAIYKWDSSWTLVDSHLDPIGSASLSGTADHCGDLDVYDGILYIPIEQYPTPAGTQHIVKFNASDLSYVAKYDISAQGHEAASIAYCDRDNLLYIVDYDGNNDTIYKYDPTDGTYIGTLVTDKSVLQRQGITWWRDHFWVSIDSGDETIRFTYEGSASLGNLSGGAGGIGFGSNSSGNYEGIGHRDEDLIQLIDPGSVERVEIWRPLDMDLGAGGGYYSDAVNEHARAVGRSTFSVFTIGCTVAVESKNANRAIVSYWDESSGTANTNRVTVAYDFPNDLAVWDTNNSWLQSTVDPTANVAYRVNVIYNGTTARHIFINGGTKQTDSTITAAPSGLDTLMIGAEDADLNEWMYGYIGFVYLRGEVLSDDWIAAEYLNLNTPASFYSITGS